mmetsp:Transcript_17121/g.28879  ORF Transcript_17121/g.28879 Transcript_17121/m.28879 type:complete len:326 (+) Transcript_17121:2768-3745(+)
MIAGTTPVQQVKKSSTTLQAYYVIFFLAFALKLLQVFTRLWNDQWVLVLVSLCFDLFSVTLHIVLACVDPGYLKNRSQIDFMQRLKIFDSSQLCPECETIRTSRSRHCIICHRCVDRYDHHCPWINNCVGVRNHNVFLLYILCQFVSVIITCSLGVLILVEYIEEPQATYESSLLYSQLERAFGLFDEEFFLGSVGLVILLSFAFVIPLVKLISVQLANFFSGRTTNERFSRALMNQLRSSESSSEDDYEFDTSDKEHVSSSNGLASESQNKSGPEMFEHQFKSKSHAVQRFEYDQFGNEVLEIIDSSTKKPIQQHRGSAQAKLL